MRVDRHKKQSIFLKRWMRLTTSSNTSSNISFLGIRRHRKLVAAQELSDDGNGRGEMLGEMLHTFDHLHYHRRAFRYLGAKY